MEWLLARAAKNAYVRPTTEASTCGNIGLPVPVEVAAG